jgi:hypothetical protein
MLTEADLAEERRKIGRTVHLHDGVWWEAITSFYTKPVFEFRSFVPKQARPYWPKSFLGYSHQVPDRRQANRVLQFMILEGADLSQFSMARLRSEKRNQVRKGLRLCEVRPISDLESCLEEMRQINISQAKRLMEDGTFGFPHDYYVKHERQWKADIRKHAAMRGHEWWGAFHQGHLVAYMVTYQVEHIRFIQIMKTHTEHLKLCATDAIYFTVLEQVSRTGDCERIVNGGPAREGLNRFKEQFLFKPTEVFYYTPAEGLHRVVKKLLGGKDVLRAHWLRLRRGIALRPRAASAPGPGPAEAEQMVTTPSEALVSRVTPNDP